MRLASGNPNGGPVVVWRVCAKAESCFGWGLSFGSRMAGDPSSACVCISSHPCTLVGWCAVMAAGAARAWSNRSPVANKTKLSFSLFRSRVGTFCPSFCDFCYLSGGRRALPGCLFSSCESSARMLAPCSSPSLRQLIDGWIVSSSSCADCSCFWFCSCFVDRGAFPPLLAITHRRCCG